MKKIILTSLFLLAIFGNLVAATYTFHPASTSVKYIAANDSSASDKAAADSVCDGTADDVEIQSLIAEMTSGGILYFYPGTYNIADTVTVGDGDNDDLSSVNGIKLIGLALGHTYLRWGATGGVIWEWTGAEDDGPMLQFNGPISGVGLENILLDCNSLATIGMTIYSSLNGEFRNFNIRSFKSHGLECLTRTGVAGSPTTFKHSRNNVIENFVIGSTYNDSGVRCLYMDGTYDAGNYDWDWSQNSFRNGYLLTTYGNAAELLFTDSNTFQEVDFSSTNGYGILFNGATLASYPDANVFVGCSITSTSVSGTIDENFFMACGVGDGETLPTDSNLKGFSTDGDIFNWSTVTVSATVPATGSAGQYWFQNTTGRKILYQYDGSAWYPLHGYGALVYYVDGANGTNDQDHGTGTTTSAFDTLAYAVSQIPRNYDSTVTINCAAGTENLAANLNIYDKRNLTITGAWGTAVKTITDITSGVRGVTTTQGSITKASAFDVTASSTVDTTSTVGSTALYVADTTNFTAGGTISVGAGTDREEIHVIKSITVGSHLTVEGSLEYEHTDGDADAVVQGAHAGQWIVWGTVTGDGSGNSNTYRQIEWNTADTCKIVGYFADDPQTNDDCTINIPAAKIDGGANYYALFRNCDNLSLNYLDFTTSYLYATSATFYGCQGSLNGCALHGNSVSTNACMMSYNYCLVDPGAKTGTQYLLRSENNSAVTVNGTQVKQSLGTGVSTNAYTGLYCTGQSYMVGSTYPNTLLGLAIGQSVGAGSVIYNYLNYNRFLGLLVYGCSTTWGGKVLGTVNNQYLGIGTSDEKFTNISGSTTWDPGPCAAQEGTSTTVTVTGARVGDRCNVSHNGSNAGDVMWSAQITSANTATVRIFNPAAAGGAAVDVGSGTVSVDIALP